MLLCSSLTFAVSFIDPITTAQSINNFLPSLTFLDPRVFDVILKPNKFEYIDAVYWTLFTEIRFYLLVALLYFLNKERFFIHVLIFSSAVGLIFLATIYLEVAPLRSALNFLLIAWYLPWFTFGIGCFYLSSNELKEAIWLMTTSFAFLMFYVLAATYKPFMPFSGVAHIMGALLIFTLMIAAIKIVIFKDILSCKFLSSIGLTSYSLYLLHRNIGQQIISTIGNPFNLTPAQSGIYPLFTLTFLMAEVAPEI
jgi:peptidoglycan/LPS O-acetylase OafA/YrhL